ncbi:MAG: AraC family transcriptional regulator [Comamonas sp.]
MTQVTHQFHRHPLMPFAELRVSHLSPHCFRLHAHDEYSIGIIDHGRALYNHASGPDTVDTGSVILIEPGRWHACNPDSVAQWAYRMLFVQADWVHAQLQTAQLRFHARALHDPQARALVDALCQPITRDADVAPRTQLLLQALRQFATPQASTSPVDARDTAVRQALAQLHAEPHAATRVQAMAAAAGMTDSRFIRHFKAATGVTPGAYRLNLRINGARRLLAQGKSLADAAHHMGFADQAHMQRAFKAYHSLTPGSYAAARM